MKDMRASSGFSIIEMMISFLTVGVVMLGVFELVNSFQGNYSVGQENTSLRQNLQLAMNIMLREIREAGNDPNGVNIVPVAIDPNNDSVDDDLRIQKDSNPPDDTQATGLTDPCGRGWGSADLRRQHYQLDLHPDRHQRSRDQQQQRRDVHSHPNRR